MRACKKILIPTIALLAALLIVPARADTRADTMVIGGGWIIDEDGHHANFAFNVDSNLNGQVQYSVSGEWHMSSTGITGFRHRDASCPTWVEIRGTCRVTDLSTGLTYDDVFQLEVEDFGEPGGEGHPEGNLGDWIIMYVGGEGAGTPYWYCSWEGVGPGPPTGQHIDGGNILHMGLLGPYP